MASSRRKSTDNVQRKAVRQVDAEVREISPQEKRRNIFIQIGVWFLVIAFCMTSGIMCFAIGGPEDQNGQEQAQGAVDEIQSEIDRYTKEVGTDASNIEALANLGYYWMQKGDTLSTAESLKQEAKTKAAIDKDLADKGQTPAANKDAKKEMSREEAYANARTYLTQALGIDQNYLLAKKTLADLEVREAKEDAAIKLYKEIIKFCEQPLKLNPGDDETTIKTSRNVQKVEAEVQLARLYGSKKQYKEAIPLLDDAVKIDPGNIGAYHVKAIISFENNDNANGVKAMNNAILIAKNMGEIDQAIQLCFELAQIQQSKNGDKAAAKKAYEEARDMIPANMGGQAAQMRSAIQEMIDELDGKKPAASAKAPAAKATPATEAPVAEATPANEAPAAEAAPATEASAAEATPTANN